MGIRYRIRGWDELFENAQSRKCARLTWVPVPNKHDGKSFRRLMGLPNGPSLYGAWLLLLQVASKCPERGVLADEDGPLTAEDLSLKTGCPESLFAEVFTELVSNKIPWLMAERLDENGEVVAEWERATSPLPAPSTDAGLNGRELNRTNGTEKKDAADAAGVSAKSQKRPAKTQEPVPIPSELDTEAGRKALAEFREHRRQMRKPLTAMAETKLFQEWSPKGSDRFVAAVDRSIANGWQGVFESQPGVADGSVSGAARRNGLARGRIQAPVGKYDSDDDVIDLRAKGGLK